METAHLHLQVRPVLKREHFLFNLLNFMYFRKIDYKDRFPIESNPLSLFIVVPYVLFLEAYFFRQERYFLAIEKQTVGVLTLQEKKETLFIKSLAVSALYRKIGIATHALNHAKLVASQLHKTALELSVLKTNTPALRLYRKYGFRKKEERRRSIILRKIVNSH
jgi:ribosomal protein S18 acetylase RimI-like enzyme